MQAEAAAAQARIAVEELAALLGPSAEDAALFRAIRNLLAYPGEAFSARSVIRLAATMPGLAACLTAVFEEQPSAARLGIWLRGMITVEIDALCVRQLGVKDVRNSSLWTIDLPGRG